ncbi:FCD domain-containing protein [Chthonobacter albigriseus]|uniref:FCD domain-containing protein n=1 Tax=Chthonobacter albigriseus TaxID=1683161 RepID=UPI0015EE760D|nr:FCD domain-containing protein [Chthonobacter albigriseus]
MQTSLGAEDALADDLEPAALRAADTVVRELEIEIASGRLADGEHLPAERELMSRFGISRTVVREAIARLASQGLVESRPRFRPVVRRPGYDTALSAVGGVVAHLLREPGGVKTLYDVRIFLEAALVRNAALHARKDDIAALREAIEANRLAIDDSERFYATDVAFHAVFYRIPRNPVFPAVHIGFTEWLSDHWRRMPRSPERNRVNFSMHKAIYDAVVERDPDAAEKALQSHLHAAWEYVRGTFETA